MICSILYEFMKELDNIMRGGDIMKTVYYLYMRKEGQIQM